MTTQHDNPLRRHTGRPILYLCLLLAVVLPLGLYVKARLQWGWRVDTQIKAIRAAGLPANLAELNAWYRLPPGVAENAAGCYLDAFACYLPPTEEDANKVPWGGTAERPARSGPLPDPTREAIGRFVAANKRALDLLHEAASIPACRYTIDFRKGYGALMPWLSEIRKSMFMLVCEAMLHTEHAEKDAVVRSLEAAFAVGDSLLEEPTLTSQLVRTSVRSAVVTSLERVLSNTQLSNEQLVAIDRALTRGGDPNGFRRGLVGERVLILDLMQQPGGLMSISSSASQRPIGAIVSAIYSGLGLMRRDQGEYLEIMASSINALDVPASQRLASQKDIDEQIRRIPATHIGTHLLIGALGRIDELELRSQAHLRAARTAIAIERYRLKSGSLPTDVNALVPEYLAAVPLDPFTGDAIKYKPLAKGYVVYSVGNDLSDDGGRERTVRKHDEPPVSYDITFIVER